MAGFRRVPRPLREGSYGGREGSYGRFSQGPPPSTRGQLHATRGQLHRAEGACFMPKPERSPLLEVQKGQKLFADAVPQLPGIRGRDFHLFSIATQQDAIEILPFPPRQIGQELSHVQFHIDEVALVASRLPQSMRFPFAAAPPELTALVPHHLKPSDGRQVLLQPRAFNRLESAE